MYGHHIELSGPFERVVERVTDALKDEGFGVLSDIDIQKAIKDKLGVDMSAYRILGACNPPLAHRALQAEPEIGLLLPCNVTVREEADGKVSVGFLDPQTMVQMTSSPGVASVADEAGERLRRPYVRDMGDVRMGAYVRTYIQTKAAAPTRVNGCEKSRSPCRLGSEQEKTLALPNVLSSRLPMRRLAGTRTGSAP